MRKIAVTLDNWDFLTTDDKITLAAWFPGTERDWKALSTEERENAAFNAHGCLYAWPTWRKDQWGSCVHIGCQIRRGERTQIHKLNGQIYHNGLTNYWRFLPRKKQADLVRAYRKAARQTGIYEFWDIGGLYAVFAGLDIG